LEVPQSWEELDRQMAFFHAPQEGRYGGALFRVPQYLAWEWWIRFHAKGVWPLSPELVPQIAGEAGVTALEEMIRAGQSLVPEVKSMGLFDNWARYARGDVYANIGWGGTQKYLNGPGSAMRGRMIFGPTPGGGPGLGSSVPYFNWGWSYVICAASTRPELAYLFSLFASTPRMSTLAVSQPDGFFDPFRPEHYEDPGIVAAYSAPFLKVQQAAMRGAIPDFYLQGRADYFAALTRWLDAALHQDVPPEVALRRVATAWDQITQRAGPEKQRRRWQQLRAKYPASMRLSLRDWNS
jgi:multiple sugar transport system substrate-binding protein